MRQRLDLNGIWRFTPDPCREGIGRSFFSPSFDVRQWLESPVPGCFEHACPELEFYEGVCWYRRTFEAPKEWRDSSTHLHFGCVNYRCRVWLNGVEIGANDAPFLPVSFDVTSRLAADAPNVLALEVDNSHHEGDVPGMHVGWRGFGGILRDVFLEAAPPVRFADVAIEADPTASRENVRLTFSLLNGGHGDPPLEVAGDILTAGETHVRSLEPTAVSASDATLVTHVDDPALWSPDSPKLYTLRLRLRRGAETLDEYESRFGFRSFVATAEGLRLNGTPMYLTGFNRHEDSPVTGAAQDLALVRRDLERMKEAGANTVRLCHYPHHPTELDLCDELGLIAFCEIPLYFWNDAEDGRRNNPARTDAAARQLTRLVARDRNHPSIAFWSVSNETADEESEVAESNRALIRHVRALDPNRFCVHVSNKWRSHPNFDEDDVICINGYPSMRAVRRGAAGEGVQDSGAQDHDFAGAADEWRRDLTTLRERYPDKPVLITEFGFCSLPGTHDHAFGEETHAAAIEAEFGAMDAPYVCGALIWCWADHAWPPGRFEEGYAISPFGVLTRSRRPLAPYRAARRLFRARLGMPEPDAERPKSDTYLLMVRDHMRGIPQIPLPEGYTMSGMRIEDIGVWTDVQRDAEEYLTIRDSLFMDQFGDDLPSIGRRCFILYDREGLAIGTISAWYNRNFRGRDWGRIHWVALRPSHQGRGLGKAMLTYAMNVLARHHERAYLDTDTRREAAVGLYRKYGFEDG